MNILILNAYSRNSLAVVNHLDREYGLVGAAARNALCERIGSARWLKSPRLKDIERYTNPQIDADRFREDIVGICCRRSIDAVIPTGTVTTNFLSRFKQDLEARTGAKMLVEEYRTLSRLTDKWHTYRLCSGLGVPVPKTALVRDEPSFYEELRTFSPPIVLKPRISYAARGVAFFDSQEAFERRLGPDLFEPDGDILPWIIQEKVEGDLHDVTALAKGGRIRSLMSQRRLVSLYDFGGGGIVNITTHEPVMMEYARRILASVSWNGVALFDFMKTRAGEYVLLEINPKFWGTTGLTIEAGLNVAQDLVDLFVRNHAVEPKHGYEVGLLYKWLFPECAYHVVHSPRTASRVFRRLQNVLSRHGASRVLNNLELRNLAHLVCIVLERSEV